MKRFKGFTLTELMIALAVIGIIVAIVTPAIVRTRPNKNKMMIKKSYYTAENVISSLINDERLYPNLTDYCYTDPIDTKCRWGFDDTSKVNYEGEDYEGDDKFLKLFKSKLNVKKEITGTNGTSFLTSDGVSWEIEGSWTGGKKKVGTFDPNSAGLTDETDTAGEVLISIGVEGEDSRDSGSNNIPCTNNSTDCNFYIIEVLANGKMRIHPTYKQAIKYVEIGTSLQD